MAFRCLRGVLHKRAFRHLAVFIGDIVLFAADGFRSARIFPSHVTGHPIDLWHRLVM
jgi:hypothetical protein